MLDTVASLLKEKEKAKLVSVAPTASVADAVKTMKNERIGAVVVLDQQKLVGIFTERDVLFRVVGEARDPLTTRSPR
jgi:CBS domain-containing protein